MNRRILIVEDREDWQKIISRNLLGLDCEVDMASSYSQALKLMKQHHYAVAIVDPVLDVTNKYNRDGMRVLLELHQRSPYTRLIVVSGSLNHSSLRQFSELPPRLPLIEKQSWDREAFRALVEQLLATEGYPPLPDSNNGEQVERSSTQEMPPLPPESKHQGVPRILIIEDRPDWQVILSRVIDQEGWFWRSVGNVDDALHMFKHLPFKFHIVLLDLRLGDAEVPMREGQGWRLLDYLAREEIRTHVVIVSGEASRGDVAELFMKYRIAGFVDKDTFQKTSLINVLKKLLAGPNLKIQTLGGFHVWRDEQPINDFGHEQAEAFLKILVTQRGAITSFDDLVSMLGANGGEMREERTNLGTIANALRTALEPELLMPGDSAFIVRQEAAYGFNLSSHVSLDYLMLESILQKGLQAERDGAYAMALKTYEEALSLYQGEYLPADRSKQWTVRMRTHLQSQYVQILNRLADLYARDQRLREAIEAAQLSIKQDAYHESTYRRLMRYYACNGQKEAALRTYATLDKLLNEFFEESPGAETRSLKAAIERGEVVACVEEFHTS